MLGSVSLGADLIADVVTLTRDPEPNRIALARIDREREAAMARYRRDRDARALDAAMGALDEQEAAAREPLTPTHMDAAEVTSYLRDLPKLWDDAPDSRRALAESLFARIDVLGLATMQLEPTPAAIARGVAEAFSRSFAGYGRGERDSPATIDLPITMRLAEPPEPFELDRSA